MHCVNLLIWSVDSRKILKITATRGHILRLKCTKFWFRLGLRLRPWPHWESLHLQHSPITLSWTWATLLRRGEGGERKGWDGRGGEENGKGGESDPTNIFNRLTPMCEAMLLAAVHDEQWRSQYWSLWYADFQLGFRRLVLAKLDGLLLIRLDPS